MATLLGKDSEMAPYLYGALERGVPSSSLLIRIDIDDLLGEARGIRSSSNPGSHPPSSFQQGTSYTASSRRFRFVRSHPPSLNRVHVHCGEYYPSTPHPP